jgi:hypothetical protein
MARENTGILMRCGRCLQQSVVSEMKYAKDGTTLVCTNCRGSFYPGTPRETATERTGAVVRHHATKFSNAATRAPAAASPFLARI